MKKILLSALIFTCFQSFGQGGWTRPNNSHGTLSKGVGGDSAVYLPTGNGAPSGAISTYTAPIRRGNIYLDSTNFRLYVYNPSTGLWDTAHIGAISAGGSPNTSIGSAYKIAVNGTNDVKSLYGNWGAILDSATSGQVGILVDTSSGKVATQTMLATKLNISDTANMRFRPYAGSGIGLSGSYPNITISNTRDLQGSMIESSVLTQHNDIDAAGFDFRIDDAGELGLAGDSIVLAANAGANHFHLYGDSASVNKRISYESNLRSTFTQYSLVDKNYVDSSAAIVPSLTATRLGYGDGSNLLTGSAALTFNSGTGIVTTPKLVINTTVDAGGATDAAVLINRTLNVANNGHGYKDYTSVTNDATSYASFDAQITMASTGASDHNVAFQARHIINKGAGLLSTNWGFIDNTAITSPVINAISFETNQVLSGGAAVTNRMGLRIKDYAGANNLATNTYGIWFDALTRASNDKYGMYDNGSNKHYLSDIRAGSRLYVGGDATADSTLDIVNGIWGKRGVRFSALPDFADTTSYKPVVINSSGTLYKATYWPGGGGSGADALGTYLVQTATNAPANAQVMGALGTGIVKNTTTTGVQSIAVAGDFPTLNQNTTGSAATLTTTRTIWGQNFNGSANVTGDITLGANNLTMTGSLAATGARVTKGWFTDVESTNMYTVGGTPLSSTFSPIAGSASIATVGTITSGGLGTGAVIGGVTMTLGSDANYDTYYRNSSGVLTRLGNGTTGQFLGANTGAAPTWQTPAGGGGDMILASVQSVTGAKTFDKDKILMKGTSTGVTTWSTANTGASNYTFETPAANITAAQLTKLTTSTSANTASTIAERDANNTIALNNIVGATASTATAAGTTTLTVASKQEQIFTGTSTQNCDLPDATTLTLYTGYRIKNTSTGVVTIRTNGGATLKALAANTEAFVQVTNIGTSAGTWDVFYSTDLAVGTGTATHIDFAAGTTSVSPANYASGTLKTTPADGDFEMNGDAAYLTTDAGNRGVIPAFQFIRADATRTYTSNTSSQAIFDSPTNGTLTLETGLYEFEGLLLWTAMSATSGNRSVDILGAGTATTAAWAWVLCGIDNSTLSSLVDDDCPALATNGSAASCVTAGTGTGLRVRVKGSFEVTGAGTIIPSTTMVTAAASVLSIGSILKFWRIGSTSAVSVGQWN